MYIFSDEIISCPISIKDAVRFAETESVSSFPVREYMITKLLNDDNALSDVTEKKVTPGVSLKKLVINDLTSILKYIDENDVLKDYTSSARADCPCKEFADSLCALSSCTDAAKLYELLTEHLLKFGRGYDGKYLAYVWNNGLSGVSRTDTASLDNLYCIDRQLKTLTDNTEAFLNGKGANNVLLYGNSGCGKSTSVKALLNKYSVKGLRLVQLDKSQLSTLPSLINTLSHKPFKFIVFIDDLSFEENDGDYKPLKTALEGRIEGQADNVLFYATSNRFHIINETWAQRAGDDIHSSDTRNERLSLSERFGIRIHFLSPNQNDYLKIVESILSENGIQMTSDIRSEALKWEVYYNGKSGRTASQFVKAYLSGNLQK